MYTEIDKNRSSTFSNKKVLGLESKENIILVDSGCTSHIEKNKSNKETLFAIRSRIY